MAGICLGKTGRTGDAVAVVTLKRVAERPFLM